MSGATINAAFVRTYKTNVELLLQQKGSKLRGCVMEDSYVGESGMAVEQIGAVSAQKKVTRHSDTPLIETPHSSRWVYPTYYEWADLISDIDKIKRLTDPRSPYAQNGAYAMGRAIDNEIITAFFGDAKTGNQGSSTTSFATATQQVAVTVGAGAATGLNLAKLREAKRILMRNNVDVESEEIYAALTDQQMDDLLAITQAVSLDYQTKPVLENGIVTKFMGINFVHTQLLGVDGSAYRRIPVWAKSGMHVGIWNDIETRIDERSDKSYDVQVYVKGAFGSTRIEEGKVVEVLCSEV